MSSSPAEFSIAPQAARDPFKDRKPPWSEDAEQAVLGAMLLDADAIVRAVELVDETMFYREAHRRMFRAMLSLHQQGAVLDPLTLANELEKQGGLAAAGGKDYIGTLLDVVPTAANVEYHLRIVKEKALRRRLIEVAQGLVVEAHESGADAADLIDLAEHRIFQVSQQRGTDGFTRIKELLWPAMERIESLKDGGPLTGVPTGFKDLDTITLGFQPSDLIIIAARPSMGKTAFVLNIAQYAAVESNIPIAIFSLEMSKESLIQRMLASEGFIDAQRLRSGKLTSQDHSNLAKAAALLGQAPIWIDDTPGITLLEIRSRARRLKSTSGVKMIIIDYLQLIQGPPNSESRQQEISADLAIAENSREGTERSGRRAVAALARARTAHGREQTSAALRPARIGRDRAGRRCRDVHLSTRDVRPRDRRLRQSRRKWATALRSKDSPKSSCRSSATDRPVSCGSISASSSRASRIGPDARLARTSNYTLGAKAKTVYRCTECGAEHLRWSGKCDTCGEWNTLVEEVAAPRVLAGGSARRKAGVSSLGSGGAVSPTPRIRDVIGAEDHRLRTGLAEFDFVLGGGIVPGSMVLVGGEPGIGKSTILLQVAAQLQAGDIRTLYVSGEESPLQVKLRADRLGGKSGDVEMIGETLLETILATAADRAPSVMIVDSIQTVFTGDLEGAPGNVGQVRECAARLMRFAKESGTAVFVVGHVTKGGGIAGPKTLEHIVDTVLYFEGEGTLDHRVLRATKNRFGSVDEIGVFRMTQQGLIPVENASALFLGDREATSHLGERDHRDSRGHAADVARSAGARGEGGLRHAAARRRRIRCAPSRAAARGAR